jgi:hypothetical protein
MKAHAISYTYGTTEFAAPPAWPRVKIANPSADVFGSGTTIVVDPCLFKMARFAANDSKHPDGVFTSAAGTDQGQGVLPMVLGFEGEDSEGNHPILEQGNRDILADVNVEPISKFAGTGYHFDGGDNCKTTGDWPRQWHTRGAIHIVETIKAAWLVYKHVKNTTTMRREASRSATAFLDTLPASAFEEADGTQGGVPAGEPLRYVDTSDALNTTAVRRAGYFKSLVGLGFVDDAKFIEVGVTRVTEPSA